MNFDFSKFNRGWIHAANFVIFGLYFIWSVTESILQHKFSLLLAVSFFVDAFFDAGLVSGLIESTRLIWIGSQDKSIFVKIFMWLFFLLLAGVLIARVLAFERFLFNW